MFVCVCKAISDADIRAAVDRGEVSSLACLQRRYGLGTGCGSCRKTAVECLAQSLEKHVAHGAAITQELPAT